MQFAIPPDQLLLDIDALQFIRAHQPTLETEMPAQVAQMPVYDGKENIVLTEIHFIDREMLAVIFFISGNADETLNGWAVRLWANTTMDGKKHLKIITGLHDYVRATGGFSIPID